MPARITSLDVAAPETQSRNNLRKMQAGEGLPDGTYGFEAAIAAHVAGITSDMPRDCLDVAPDSRGNGVPLRQGAQSRRPWQLEVRVDQGSDARGTDILNDSTPLRCCEQTARC